MISRYGAKIFFLFFWGGGGGDIHCTILLHEHQTKYKFVSEQEQKGEYIIVFVSYTHQ